MPAIPFSMLIVRIIEPKNSGNIMQPHCLSDRAIKIDITQKQGRSTVPVYSACRQYQPSMMGANLMRMFGSFVIVV